MTSSTSTTRRCSPCACCRAACARSASSSSCATRPRAAAWSRTPRASCPSARRSSSARPWIESSERLDDEFVLIRARAAVAPGREWLAEGFLAERAARARGRGPDRARARDHRDRRPRATPLRARDVGRRARLRRHVRIASCLSGEMPIRHAVDDLEASRRRIEELERELQETRERSARVHAHRRVDRPPRLHQRGAARRRPQDALRRPGPRPAARRRARRRRLGPRLDRGRAPRRPRALRRAHRALPARRDERGALPPDRARRRDALDHAAAACRAARATA